MPFSGIEREGNAVLVAEKGAGDGVRQRDPSRFEAQHRGRREGVEIDPGVDLVEAQRVERGPRRGAPRRIFLTAQHVVTAAEGFEGLTGGGAELDDVFRQRRVHPLAAAPSRSRDTIIRCTSMVPLATVAACA